MYIDVHDIVYITMYRLIWVKTIKCMHGAENLHSMYTKLLETQSERNILKFFKTSACFMASRTLYYITSRCFYCHTNNGVWDHSQQPSPPTTQIHNCTLYI